MCHHVSLKTDRYGLSHPLVKNITGQVPVELFPLLALSAVLEVAHSYVEPLTRSAPAECTARCSADRAELTVGNDSLVHCTKVQKQWKDM